MDKTRTLPPLVRGKVTGVMEFFVDEIALFRNTVLLTDYFDLILQVQWWGERLAAHIRPRKLQKQDKNSKNSQSLEFYYHCAKYEIKTTLDFFKSYLKTCERMELCVLEVVKNGIIGSAFLTNVISLLNSNEPITLPIFDYLGEIIGEVTIHITFFRKPQQKYEQNQYINSANDKENYLNTKFNQEDCKISNNVKSNSFTSAEKTLFYNIHSKENSQKGELLMQLYSSVDNDDFKKNKYVTNSNIKQSLNNTSDTLFSCQEINMNYACVAEKKGLSCECLPEVTTLNDSSKVLQYGAHSQLLKLKDDNKSNTTKVIDKFNSNSVKCKSKSKSTDKLSSFSKIKKTEFAKNLPTKIKNIKNYDIKELSFDKFREPEMLPCYKQTDLQNIPLKESSTSKVLDYLLGSEMSKEDEETALSDFKKMSPSHNLVDSINQLCLVSNKNTQSWGNNCFKESPLSSRSNHLNFDLNNPIEKNYYEKFFFKSNSIADFEVAEFLNQSENRVILDKLKYDEIISHKNGSQTNSFNEFSHSEKEIGEDQLKENYSINEISVGEKANSCVRCKYFKKLDELDTIIESLKHFEEKMHKHDKDLESVFKKTLLN